MRAGRGGGHRRRCGRRRTATRASRRSAASSAARASTSCRSCGTCCKGDMSFVGPRPERPEFVAELTRADSASTASGTWCGRASPGGRRCCYTYGATVEDALQKLQYDLYYIKNLSIALDLFIIFETIKTVVLRKGALTVARDRPARIVNAMTIDVEDYFHVSVFDGVVPRAAWDGDGEPRRGQHRAAARPVRRVRRARHVLRARLGGGAVSGRWCGRSRARGHELASHGYAHRLVYDQTPDEFREDVRRAKDAARGRRRRSRCAAIARPASRSRRDRSGRSTSCSRRATRYDASIFPIRHDRYGIPDAPRWPHHDRARRRPDLRGARLDGPVRAARTCRSPAAATSASCRTRGRGGASRA